jgi:hypothetical protein
MGVVPKVIFHQNSSILPPVLVRKKGGPGWQICWMEFEDCWASAGMAKFRVGIDAREMIAKSLSNNDAPRAISTPFRTFPKQPDIVP